MQTQYFTGKYGVATTIYFTLDTPAATNSDTLFVGVAPLQADLFIFQDGVYDSTADNAPAISDAGGAYDALYKVIVSAAEMTANRVDIIIHDVSATLFRDAHLVVETHKELSSLDIDAATGTKANTSAVKLTGYGSGHGLETIAGATGSDIWGILGKHVQRAGTMQSGTGTSVVLDSSANASNDYYNGGVILFYSGTGAGQARVIIDYVGATKTCTLNKSLSAALNATTKYAILPGNDAWSISPGVELAAIPTFTSGYGALIQFLFQRFGYKRTQSDTEFKMYKVDDATVFGGATAVAAIADTGGTQTHGRYKVP